MDRTKHPRMTLARDDFEFLNGVWGFEFDTDDRGLKEKWYKDKKFSKKIVVPYVYQCEKSGINVQDRVEVIWYGREFSASPAPEIRTVLHFGAVDYHATVWVNGELAGSHAGGYTSFEFDITSYIIRGKNTLIVRAADSFDRFQVRGKQYCPPKIDRCFYEASSGIWQDVWLERTGEYKIDNLRITPSIKDRCVRMELNVNKFAQGLAAQFQISYNGETARTLCINLDSPVSFITADIYEDDFVDEKHYWMPESPNLYDVKAELVLGGKVTDTVYSYFGMREVEVRNGDILLNNQPLYQRLVLHQGYFDGALYTASDEQLKADIELIKSYGFNGVRMHQKIEHPRFYYWADKLGLLVWGEMPSCYQFYAGGVSEFFAQTAEFVGRDYNCPSIIMWVPFNESWGVRNVRYDKRQIEFVKGVSALIKAMDPVRLVSGNDGWEIAGSDIIGVHNYYRGGERFTEDLSDAEKYALGTVNNFRQVLCDGESLDGRPILLTEYGGISFASDNGWGYAGAAETQEEYLQRFEDLQKRIYTMPLIKGFCYTQLTDVYQETNGLTDMQRRPKIEKELIKPLILGGF